MLLLFKLDDLIMVISELLLSLVKKKIEEINIMNGRISINKGVCFNKETSIIFLISIFFFANLLNNSIESISKTSNIITKVVMDNNFKYFFAR